MMYVKSSAKLASAAIRVRKPKAIRYDREFAKGDHDGNPTGVGTTKLCMKLPHQLYAATAVTGESGYTGSVVVEKRWILGAPHLTHRLNHMIPPTRALANHATDMRLGFAQPRHIPGVVRSAGSPK